MASAVTRTSRAHWLVLALPAVGAAVMLVVVWLGWVQSHRSAEMVLRGEAALLVERVSRSVRDQASPVTDEELRDVVRGESRAGLLFAAAVRPDGEVVARSSDLPPGFDSVADLRPGDFRTDGHRAWARSQNLQNRGRPQRDRANRPPRDDQRPPRDDRGPPSDDRRPPGDDERPSPGGDRAPAISLVVLFEPALVTRVDRAADATAVAGILGALGLLLLGALALRLLRKNEEALRRLEQEKRLASLGAMSAVVAHELRNPLAALKGHAQLLVESLDAQPKEKAQAERVVEGAWRLERLSTSLLELARRGTLSREVTTPASLVRAAAVQVGGDRVRVDDSAAPPAWSLDPLRFQQVVVNLVDNAMQAAPGQPVEVRIARDGELLVVDVRDHGPGVPVGERERIFEPFVTTRARGVGLGLAVARQIVMLHGGTLGVDEAPGGGARFRVAIPEP